MAIPEPQLVVALQQDLAVVAIMATFHVVFFLEWRVIGVTPHRDGLAPAPPEISIGVAFSAFNFLIVMSR